MTRLIILGAAGSLGSEVLRQALATPGLEVTALVRDPGRLGPEVHAAARVVRADIARLSRTELAAALAGHDALINAAGLVTQGQAFVELMDHLVSSIETLPENERPACWFLAGAGLLDLDSRGRRGLDLPKVRNTYWPHGVNFARIRRSSLDWRVLCPGPMVAQPAVGLASMRVSLDTLPAPMPAAMRLLPGPLLLIPFVRRIPEMIVPYADAAALMLAHLARDDAMRGHRVGLALPPGQRGQKDQWAAQPAGRA